METQELKKVLASPSLFTWAVLGIEPTRYQAELLESEKDCIVVWGRQNGKTTTLAAKALHRAITRPNQEILIIAPTQRQAGLMFSKIFDMCEFNAFLKEHTMRRTLSNIEFDSGSKIHCLPAGHQGDSIRGYSASLIIFDEAALVPDAVFLAVRPSMAVRGEQIIMSGTPFGKRGYFYDQYRLNQLRAPAKRKWDVFQVPASQSPFIDKEFLEEMRMTMTHDQFAQEFGAEFIADSNSYFPYSLVLPAMDDYEYSLPRMIPANGQLIMGVDIARAGSDDTAFCICSKTADGEFKVEWSEQHSHSLITETAGRIIELAGQFPDMKIYIDATGLGAGALDVVQEHNVEVTGVIFTPLTRNKMYSNLKLAMEQHRIKFSAHDKKMAQQFGNFTGRVSSDGAWKIVKGDGHDDTVDALALCFCGEASLEWNVLGEGWELNPLRRMQKPTLFSEVGSFS